MKIYIAAPYPIRDEAIVVMRKLEAKGHEVTSRWLKDDEDVDALSEQPGYADKSLRDVARADVLLSLNDLDWDNRGTGGRHVEFGYALALNIEVVLLGVRTNVFHHLAKVRVIQSLDEL